jgi:hypothetical protein
MPLLIFFLCLFCYLLKDENRQKANFVLFCLFTYLTVILFEQIYLENIYSIPFHVSDPTQYFDLVYKLSFQELSKFLLNNDYKSNQLYFFINWVFYNSFPDATLTALMLKFTNALVFLSAYLICFRQQPEIDLADGLVLFHPYLFVSLIRNVRDMYIIFFLVVFVSFLRKANQQNWTFARGVTAASTLGVMYTLRPSFCAVMAAIPVYERFLRSRLLTKAAFFFCIIAFVIFLLQTNTFGVRAKITSVIFSVIAFHEGFDADRDEVAQDIARGGTIEYGALADYGKRVAMGVPVFLLTPHPINYWNRFTAEEHMGMWNIYTQFDNYLITAGAALHYIIMLPVLFIFFHKIRELKQDIVIVSVFIFLLYSILQLGITDVRIKYTFFFFVLYALKDSSVSVAHLCKTRLAYLFSSFVMFVFISAVSRA